MTGKARARLLHLGAALGFGLMAVLARRLAREDGGFSAGQLAVVRFGVGLLVSLAAFRLRPGLHRPSAHRLLWLRGLSGGAVVVLYFLALARIPAGEAGLLYNLFPVFATLIAVLLCGERPTFHLLGGLALATLGVALVLRGDGWGLRLGTGQALALAAAGFAALSAVLIRRMRATENAPTIFFYFCLGGLPMAVPFALGPWPHAPGPWGLALLMGLAAFGAQVMMTEAYGALSVGESALWLQLTPLAQAAMASLWLAERLPAWGVAGLLLGVAGVAYGTARGARRA